MGNKVYNLKLGHCKDYGDVLVILDMSVLEEFDPETEESLSYMVSGGIVFKNSLES
jgi:ribosome biogenesis SPOUT family RNA methylase Rps3